MTIYAVCLACNSSTRLTPALAIKIAAMGGPPVSVCCASAMRIVEVDGCE